MSGPQGREAVAAVVAFAEAKVHLDIALRALHTAMAVTPLDMGHVTVMGDLARGITAQLAEHAEAIEQICQANEVPA